MSTGPVLHPLPHMPQVLQTRLSAPSNLHKSHLLTTPASHTLIHSSPATIDPPAITLRGVFAPATLLHVDASAVHRTRSPHVGTNDEVREPRARTRASFRPTANDGAGVRNIRRRRRFLCLVQHSTRTTPPARGLRRLARCQSASASISRRAMVRAVREAARLLGIVVAVKDEGESVSSYAAM